MNLIHLTDEQFADLLAGHTADSGALLHAECCEQCRNELADMRAAMRDLNFASMRWAERRSARISVPSGWALNWHALPGWGATMAAVLIFGVALGAHMQIGTQSEPVRSSVHTTAAPSDDELAQDNRLMRSIDNELTEQIGPQVPASDLDVSAHEQHRHAIREVSN